MLTPKILSTLPETTPRSLLADLVAGVTVAMVALPLSLAIAIASGAAPETGLVTAIVAGFLISLLGGSRVQIGGPTGAFIVVVYGVIATHGFDGLVLATLMAGVILVVAGLLRAGSLIRLVPEPVINGFTIGIAAIIALSQLPDAVGIVLPEGTPADALERIPAIWEARGTLDWPSLAVGRGASVVAIVALRRAFPTVSRPDRRRSGIVSAAVAVLCAAGRYIVRSLWHELARPPALPSLPEITVARLVELLPSALIIAFLAGIESLLSAMVADRMVAGRHRPSAEILAQGRGQYRLIPHGRSARHRGHRTHRHKCTRRRADAACRHLPCADDPGRHDGRAPLAGYLAMPALAGLLLVTAWNMSEPQHWRGYLTTGRVSDRVLLVLTMVLTVFADLTVAIGVGVALGLALRLRRRDVPTGSRPSAEAGRRRARQDTCRPTGVAVGTALA
jgi:sulfate permease, SulP family